jgi:hypothetical protein
MPLKAPTLLALRMILTSPPSVKRSNFKDLGFTDSPEVSRTVLAESLTSFCCGFVDFSMHAWLPEATEKSFRNKKGP